MICKYCGKEITWDLFTYKTEPDQEIPVPVPAIYNGYTDIPICGKCNMVIDYKDLPVGRFLEWLNDCTGEKEDTGNLKGKALIHYFGLDKLLKVKKEAGD